MRALSLRPADSVVKDDLVDSVSKTDLVVAANLVVADDSVGKTDLVAAGAEEHHP
jgi:hypothetical protein